MIIFVFCLRVHLDQQITQVLGDLHHHQQSIEQLTDSVTQIKLDVRTLLSELRTLQEQKEVKTRVLDDLAIQVEELQATIGSLQSEVSLCIDHLLVRNRVFTCHL